MTDDIIEALRESARELSEHLRFYEQIGVSDIGSAAKGRSGADSSREKPVVEEPPRRASIQLPQIDLFGNEIVSQRAAPIGGSPSAPARDPSLEAIRADLGDCRRCRLCDHRNNIVFGEGSPAADLMFIGEGPGADEDASGRPFVGRAGQLLDKIIASIGLRRDDVYIANVVKCRPPGNRAPERDEVATCQPFLFRQIAVIRPRVIVTLGSPALQCVLHNRDSITKVRGEWRDYDGIAVMPTFHPAYLLRTPDKKREVWEDMKKVRQYLETGRR